MGEIEDSPIGNDRQPGRLCFKDPARLSVLIQMVFYILIYTFSILHNQLLLILQVPAYFADQVSLGKQFAMLQGSGRRSAGFPY